MKNDNYVKQNGCWNCVHCFHRTDYDEGERLYCSDGAPLRPPCSSVGMSEWYKSFVRALDLLKTMTYEDEDVVSNAFYDAWDTWEKDKEVHSYGVCRNWLQEPEGTVHNVCSEYEMRCPVCDKGVWREKTCVFCQGTTVLHSLDD
jgi:hypothetical protein